MSFNIEMTAGSSVRLPTAGKYCDRDIIITVPGGGDRYNDGYEAGQQAEYDRFWDAFQQSGKRTDYGLGFSGAGWNNETFRPKYSMRPTNAYQMFFATTFSDFDLVARLEELGIALDFSQCPNMSYALAGGFSHIGVVNTTAAAGLSYTFYNSKVHTIDKLVLRTDGATTFSNTFAGCENLQNITFEGVIGTALDMHWSGKLTNTSVQSIIDHLKDLTGATAHTLTLHATVGANLTDAQKATITAKNWTLAY